MMVRLKTASHFKQDEKLLKQMKSDFLACPAAVKYIKSLKLSEEEIDENIVKINELVSDINYCKNCPGVNNCQKATPRLCTKIIYEDGSVDYQLVPCKEYLKLVHFTKQFIVKDFPDEWLELSSKSLDKTAPRKAVISKYLESIQKNDHDWIWINGEQGTGRTFLAAILSIDIAKNEKGPIAFLDVSSRFKEILSKKDAAFQALIDKYSSVPVLVLDDLGNEYKSDFVRDGILFQILNARSKAHLFTIITSDFNIEDYVTMYMSNAASKPKVEQIKKILIKNCGDEINLGNLSIY